MALKRALRLRAGLLAGSVVAGIVAVGLGATAQADGPITAEVWDTGGQTLFVRSTPSTSGSVLDQLAEGTTVTIDCQTAGTPVDGNNIWNYLPDYGGYASDRYLYTGYDGRHPDLSECESDNPDEPEPPPGDIRDRIVDLARGELGNTDKSRYGAPWDHDWCQYFVNWVWRNAGVEDMNDTHFTGDFYYWGKERGLTRDGWDNIQVGDAVLFGTGPEHSDTGRHVAIVVETHPDGSITTIDGNYTRNGVNAVHEVGPTYPWDANPPEPENVYAVVSPPEVPAEPEPEPAPAPEELVVNGHQLTDTEEANVRWIAENTVPRIGGDVDAAALVTWWSLKEGVLGLENPHEFSHCDNRRLDPLESCAPQCCWQVGIAAVQEPNFEPAEAAEVAERLYPGMTADEVLAHTATYSGYPEGTPGHDTIVSSTGQFRNSWLLRNHGVGFALNAPQVEAECVVDSLHWCYGTGWDTTAKYAPDRSAALRAIEDVRAILAQLS